ncbi:MAG TPA: transcription termination/antitermination protein NusG [Actinomycetota bacterium]|nr:transcription termination/antitermination protein NusG [Actinomycetota bacterium]
MNGTQEEMSSSEVAPRDPESGEPEDSVSREPADAAQREEAGPAEEVDQPDEASPPQGEAVPSPVEEAFEARVEEPGADVAAAETPAEREVLAEAEAIAQTAARSPAEVPSQEEQVVETTVKDPFKGPGEWYVVHTYAGYENKVKANLQSRIHTMQMEDKIFDVVIPMEDVMEIKGGKKQIVQRKVFPGYLLVRMIYDNDSWYVVRNTPGVTGFVAAGTGSKPTPLSRREVEKILAVKKEEVKPTFRLGFEEGDVVRIISGPFADFNGTINEINVDQSKLKVLVNIFDRETPVELGFDQVAKV